MNIFLASTNQGKIAEANSLFASSSHRLLSINDQQQLAALGQLLPADLEIKEDGATLTANALLKAQAWAKHISFPIIADDSGLLLAAFPGFPGVKSKRWLSGSDQERNQALLAKLAETADRQAKFQTVLVLYDPETTKQQFFVREVTGQITQQAQGGAGFGYDPLFIPDGYQQTFGQLGLKVKNKISHRAQAWEKLMTYLAKPE